MKKAKVENPEELKEIQQIMAYIHETEKWKERFNNDKAFHDHVVSMVNKCKYHEL